jgi:hypothetical protein
MVAALTVLLVLLISLIVVRVATVGLTMTGLSKDLAQFQALSAFTGSGFTTRESEEIVNHPVRRRIVMHLMLLGNAGIVILVTSGVAFLLNPESNSHWTGKWWFRLEVLALGIFVLWIVVTSRYLEQVMWRVNSWALQRWVKLDIQDYSRLLRLSQNYDIWEMHVHEENWLAGHTLLESKLASEGVLILGIERPDGIYIGAPRGQTRIEAGDQLILYGRQESLLDLEQRQPGVVGNLHHVMAVTRQIDVLEDEEKIEKSSGIESSDRKRLKPDV